MRLIKKIDDYRTLPVEGTYFLRGFCADDLPIDQREDHEADGGRSFETPYLTEKDIEADEYKEFISFDPANDADDVEIVLSDELHHAPEEHFHVDAGDITVNDMPLWLYLSMNPIYEEQPSLADGIQVEEYHDVKRRKASRLSAHDFTADDFSLGGQCSQQVAGIRVVHRSRSLWNSHLDDRSIWRFNKRCAGQQPIYKNIKRQTPRRNIANVYASGVIKKHEFEAIICLDPTIAGFGRGIDRKRIQWEAMQP